jgi:peptidoglycan L-alanyl-D-glutamate endopeptidase CwlK
VDDRSERSIATLLPKIQPYARALVTKAAANGITIKVISGLRTYEEQNDLDAQGRTKPGKIVTTRAAAIQITTSASRSTSACSKGAATSTSRQNTKRSVFSERTLGLEWGGNWRTIQDEPHFQLRPKWAAYESEKDMLAELRSRKELGQGAYA